MRNTFVLVAGILAGALAAELSFAARFTTHLDAIEGLLTTRAADSTVPTKVRKSFQSALKRLGKDTTNLSKEIAIARKVIGTIEKKAPDDAELMGAASTAVGALGTAVANYIEAVSAEADALAGKKPSPALLAQRFLTKARDRYQLQFAATSLAARLRLIGQAFGSAASAKKQVDKATGGGGGGGGGNAPCGPTPLPAGVRARAAGETVSGAFTIFSGPLDIASGAVLADVGKWTIGGYPYPMGPDTLRVKAYDCTNKGSFEILIPFPPALNTTYRSGQVPDNGVAFGLQTDYDGLTQIFPGTGTSVTVTAFDPAAKTLTASFSQAGLNTTDGVIVLKNWRDLR